MKPTGGNSMEVIIYLKSKFRASAGAMGGYKALWQARPQQAKHASRVKPKGIEQHLCAGKKGGIPAPLHPNLKSAHGDLGNCIAGPTGDWIDREGYKHTLEM